MVTKASSRKERLADILILGRTFYLPINFCHGKGTQLLDSAQLMREWRLFPAPTPADGFRDRELQVEMFPIRSILDGNVFLPIRLVPFIIKSNSQSTEKGTERRSNLTKSPEFIISVKCCNTCMLPKRGLEEIAIVCIFWSSSLHLFLSI